MLVGETGIIMELPTKEDSRYKVGFDDECTLLDAKCLRLYAEPEIKEEPKGETKKLNLCELLQGHKRETFYHLMYGEVKYKGIDKDGFIAFTDSEIPTIYDDGKYDQDANVVLYPSRTLYEQYPLDPYTAWMKWQEEQKKYALYIDMAHSNDRQSFVSSKTYYFRTPADRDKCIEEIKVIIEKYSK